MLNPLFYKGNPASKYVGRVGVTIFGNAIGESITDGLQGSRRLGGGASADEEDVSQTKKQESSTESPSATANPGVEEVVVTAKKKLFSDEDLEFARRNNPTELGKKLKELQEDQVGKYEKLDRKLDRLQKERDRLAALDSTESVLRKQEANARDIDESSAARTKLQNEYNALDAVVTRSQGIHDSVLASTIGTTVQVNGADYTIKGGKFEYSSHKDAAVDAIATGFLVQLIIGDDAERGGAIFDVDANKLKDGEVQDQSKPRKYNYTFQVGGKATEREVAANRNLEKGQANVIVGLVQGSVAYFHTHPPKSTNSQPIAGFNVNSNKDFSVGDRRSFEIVDRDRRRLTAYLGGSDGSFDILRRDQTSDDPKSDNGQPGYFGTRRR